MLQGVFWPGTLLLIPPVSSSSLGAQPGAPATLLLLLLLPAAECRLQGFGPLFQPATPAAAPGAPPAPLLGQAGPGQGGPGC